MITENQYNDLLNDLYEQGIENPEDFILEMSENDLFDLLEKFVPLKPEMVPSVYRKMKDLETKNKNRNPLQRLFNRDKKKEAKQLKSTKKALVKSPGAVKKYTDDALAKSDAHSAMLKTLIGSTKKKLAKMTHKTNPTTIPHNNIVPMIREEAEFLINYLMNEGFCENEISAEKIVSVMSEEWKNEIFLNEGIFDAFKKKPKTPEQEAKERATKLAALRVLKQRAKEGRETSDLAR